MQPMRLILLMLAALFGVSLALPSQIFAHPKIVRTEPIDGAILSRAPAAAKIFFNEPIEATFSTITVFSADGTQVTDASGGRDPNDPAALHTSLPPIDPGIYTVVWQVVGSDGHVIKGYFVFTLQGGSGVVTTPQPTVGIPRPTTVPPVPTAREQRADSELPWLPALLRALMLFSALALGGGWMVVALVLIPMLPTGTPLVRQVIWARWGRIAVLLLGVHAAAAFLFTLVHIQAVAGRVDTATAWALIRNTRLGMALGVRIATALLGVGLLTIFRQQGNLRRVHQVMGLLVSLVLLLSFALAGHAAAQTPPLVPVLADSAHLVSTALWVGGLVALMLLLPHLNALLIGQERVQSLTAMIRRYSALALISVVVLSASGTYTALLHVATLSDLWESTYGRAFGVKLALFGGMLALGAYHRAIVRTQFMIWIQRAVADSVFQRHLGRFLATVRIEVLLAVLVVGAAGLMTSTAPPAASSRTPVALPPIATPILIQQTPLTPTRTPVPSRPFAETKTVDNLQVELRAEPASIGKNRFDIFVRDGEGVPIEVQRVALTIDMPTMDMGLTKPETQPNGGGHYTVVDTWVSMVGEWRVLVQIRRLDAPDLEVMFLIPFGE